VASRTSGQDSLVGVEFGHYHIVEKIGAGGMGEVYRARDQHLARDVAIKVLPPGTLIDESDRKHFHKEALILSQLNHPNIATIHDFDTQQGVDFLVMEYIPGITLSEKVAAGPLPEKEVLRLGEQLADGLSAAHQHGVVHRDLKPGNLRLTDDGRLKILDFGLALLRRPVADSAATESLGDTQSLAGTLPYMTPEQLLGEEVDARTDIHAAGAVLYEMATGQRPFADVDLSQLIGAILHRPPLPPTNLNPRLSPELERIIEKYLEKEPENRYQSAKELAIDLRRLGGPSTSAAPVQKKERRTRSMIRVAVCKVLVSAAVILVAAAIGGTFYFHSRRTTTRLTDKDTIVLFDFDNKTGDSVFDDTLKQALSVQLRQSPFLDLISEGKLNETLKLMGRSAGDRFTPEVRREACIRTRSEVMLTGSIASLGGQYVIGLKAVNCNTGDVLAEVQEQAAGKDAVLKALDNAAVSLRSKLGESLTSIQKYATPVAQATTPSLEASKAYSLGVMTQRAKGDTASLPFYKRAVELDPNFALAYKIMAQTYGNLNQAGRSAENASKAYALREKVSGRERLAIDAMYYSVTTGELEKAAQVYQLWQQTYPTSLEPYTNLAYFYTTVGNYEKGLEQARDAVRVAPNASINYQNLGNTYTALNRLDEADAVYKQAEERKLEHEFLVLQRYQLAFLKGDAAQMVRLATAMGKPGTQDLLLIAQADTEAWYGRLKNARELTRRAMDSAQHNDAKETAAGYRATAALREVESGNRRRALTDANAAVKLAPTRDVRVMAALAMARAGDTAGAEKLAAELDKKFPLGTLVQRYWLPTIRAAVALQRKDPNRAIELSKIASPIELGQVEAIDVFLCPVYLRGEAYLLLRDGSRAAAEFQKFIDHRGVVVNFPWGALARLGLARAYALQGDTAKGRTAYQDFLTLWKDADPDIPILNKARAEYARLQ
jgi:eukaryotic-like serine/threonine-protein kinase